MNFKDYNSLINYRDDFDLCLKESLESVRSELFDVVSNLLEKYFKNYGLNLSDIRLRALLNDIGINIVSIFEENKTKLEKLIRESDNNYYLDYKEIGAKNEQIN